MIVSSLIREQAIHDRDRRARVKKWPRRDIGVGRAIPGDATVAGAEVLMTLFDVSRNAAEAIPADPVAPDPRAPVVSPADDPAWGYAFIEIHDDGTFGRIRLLATTALADATLDQQRAMAAGDWSGLAAALVTSHAIPRILAGTADDLVASVLRVDAVGAAEPVLVAALAVAERDTDSAEAALGRTAMTAGPETDGHALPHRLGVAITRLALARLTGDSTTGVELARQSRDLLVQLPIGLKDERAEMSLLVDANLGSLQASMGSVHEAAHTLTRGLQGPVRVSGYGARVDCEGQLALIEAYEGDLRSAMRRATLVLSGASRSVQAGAMHACAAMAWVHVQRGELEQAREYIDLDSTEFGGHQEPWLATSRLLAETRLLTDAGQPEAASRLLARATSTRDLARQSSPWLSDLLTIASVEAMVAEGEPQRALALITPGLAHAEVAAAVLTAVARMDIGDVRGARAALATVAAFDMAAAPLDLQIQSWLLEARLAAQADGNAERARLLIDRALRAGSAELMRRPFMHQWHWLRGYIDRDVSLMQEHRAFVASVQPRRLPLPTTVTTSTGSGGSAIGTLTERERQVLELLAQMYSTDEIAGALFVSANTVKTHLKGVFCKLGVNRRADAVRQGRELGLC